MSNAEKALVVKDIILSSEHSFKKLAEIHGAVNWEQEASFAVQILKNNDCLASMAYSHPDSLRDAVLNVASVGLSLNPVKALAYILPMNGKVRLQISYRGFIQLAIDSGAILWAKSEIVHAEDSFAYHGFDKAPEHGFSPFSERGDIVGVYCTVKTPSGDYLTEMMKIDAVYDVRNRSKSWKGGKMSPWKSDEGEMIRKTVIRRAYKSWPIPSVSAQRLEDAIKATDMDHELDVTPLNEGSTELIDSAMAKLLFLGKSEDMEKVYGFLTRIYNRKVTELIELTDYELEKFHVLLDQWIDKREVEEIPEPVIELEKELELEELKDEITK